MSGNAKKDNSATIFEKLIEQKLVKDPKISNFGELTLVEFLGRGQQAIVMKAKNPNGKLFAVKFYAPTDKESKILSKGRERFIREAKLLLEIYHRNIVYVIACGSAKWEKNIGWTISNNFEKPGNILYYIMNFVKGKRVAQIFYKPFSRRLGKYVISPRKSNQENLRLFEQIILQVSDALNFIHNRRKKIVHRDIKPDNIILSSKDRNFVLVDFGFAKPIKKGQKGSDEEIIVRKPYLDKESVDKNLPDELMDQYYFAEMLTEILELFKNLYPNRNVRGISYVLRKAVGPRKNRYKNLGELKKAVEPYLNICPYHKYRFNLGSFLIPSSNFSYFDKKIRIPVSGSIPYSDEIAEIIDSEAFQRLRNVSQLGPTRFVYPGANQSRFEHSMGTYYLSLCYLEVLLKIPEFYQELEDSEESIKLVVLTALLHDIGHYPYSHWIEELRGLPKNIGLKDHEDRAKEIILNSEIGEIIKNRWDIDPENVCKLIHGKSLTPREELLRSIISSNIDIDKVDYLQRDSTHCGVPYGTGFDQNRLINSLWINENRTQICLTEKGRSPFSSLLMSNIIMYQEVYWHKTVRACTAMFKRFFFELLQKCEKEYDKTQVLQSLNYTDEKFIDFLFNLTEADMQLNRFISPFAKKGRKLFKPAYVHYPERSFNHSNTKEFFKELAKKESNYSEQVKITRLLAEELQNSIPEITNIDIILETAPVKYREVGNLTDFKFFNSKNKRYENITSEMKGLNSYLKRNRKSFIFCDSKFYKKLRHIANIGKLNEILGNVNELLKP